MNPMPQPDVEPEVETESTHDRWAIIRDALVFQLKLVLEGIRDIVIGPLALLAALYDLMRGIPRSKAVLYRILERGYRYDLFLNLYDALDREGEPKHTKPLGRDKGVDRYVDRVTAAVQKNQDHSPLVAKTKKGVDRTLDWVQARTRSSARKKELK